MCVIFSRGRVMDSSLIQSMTLGLLVCFQESEISPFAGSKHRWRAVITLLAVWYLSGYRPKMKSLETIFNLSPELLNFITFQRHDGISSLSPAHTWYTDRGEYYYTYLTFLVLHLSSSGSCTAAIWAWNWRFGFVLHHTLLLCLQTEDPPVCLLQALRFCRNRLRGSLN